MPTDKKLNEPLKILVFSASMREGSLNTHLAKLAAAAIEKNKGVVDLATMQEFDCPSYNGDTEKTSGIAKGAEELKKRLLANDAFIIVSPEYNASMPGNLKNLIDWTSRFRPQPFFERHSMLLSASPSMVGGNRGLWSLRIPLEHLGSPVYPEMFSLASATTSFNAEGNFANEILAKRFDDTIVAFLSLVDAAKNYPCIKKAWVEFLGEPDPVMEVAK